MTSDGRAEAVIQSTAPDGACVRHGLEVALHRFGGATSARIVNAAHSIVPEHAHDWPVLSLFLLGRYRKLGADGDAMIAGPSAILHAARAAHANRQEAEGLEQIDIEFDPAWLGLSSGLQQGGIRIWTGGRAAAEATRLARLWSRGDRSETELRDATRSFLALADASSDPNRPSWLEPVRAALRREQPPTTAHLAAEFGLHPGWLAQAYRRVTGEGIGESVLRHRVERASTMLRASEDRLAEIAIAAGFCDQSHMNRGFKAITGRTPLKVRQEWRAMMAA